jgi:protocatechuate 3,4-dioxygenase beta subunit
MLGAISATGAIILVGCGDAGAGATDASTGEPGTTTTGEPGTTATGDDPTTGGPGTSSSSTSSTTTTTGDDSTTGEPGTTGSTTGDECGVADAWATGGTAAMTAKACYPDPFADGVTACPLLCETTAGPCTADTVDRQDVSEGFGGLPVRLALLVVDADTCEPVSGARVEIWHTQRTGVYSGETPGGMQCFLGEPDAVNHLYAGADGRVDFDTCFPGWYSGRALHIHFRVTLGDDTYVVSQLFFDDTITAEIFTSHPDYAEFGQPNTSNDEDNIIGGAADLADYILDVQRLSDGAMMASKVLAVRSSLADPLCAL